MSNVDRVPSDSPRVSPYLHVDGAAKAIDFYSQVFGAVERFRLEGPEGKIGHADLLIGNSTVLVADQSPEIGTMSPHLIGGSPVTLMIYVQDVDTTVQKAIDLGSTLKRPIENQFYGDRVGMIEDPFGHNWHIHTHIEDVTPEVMKERLKDFIPTVLANG